jgi:amphi-Trp domain-containing protein
MANRDVEIIRSKATFVATLRRVADAIEQGEPVRIQIASKRFNIPQSAELSIEHEVEGRDEEVELQLRWRNGAAAKRASKRKPASRSRTAGTGVAAKRKRPGAKAVSL